jgi:flagellar motor switch protein FliN/FliY
MADEMQFEALEPVTPGTLADDADLGRLHGVPVELAVEIGRASMTIGEALGLGPGSIVSLNRMAGEPVDLLVNGKRIARGEVVVIDEEFGLRITDVVSVAKRLEEVAEAAPEAAAEPPPTGGGAPEPAPDDAPPPEA